MRHIRFVLLVFPYFLGLWPIGVSAQPKDIPIAPDVAVVAPARDVPSELAAFTGKWFGPYNGVKTGAYMSDAVIIVESISSPTAIQVFYAGVGRFRTNHGQPWAYRVHATFVNGVLEFKVGSERLIHCKLNSDGTMSVTATSGDRGNRGTFRRITN